MVPTIYLAMVSIPIFYFFYAFTKKFWVKVFFNINVCAFCLAVGTTWLWMLIARAFGVLDIDNMVIALLLGHTVVGMLWKFEDYYKGHGFKKFYIIRLVYFASAEIIAFYVATMNPDYLIPALVGLLGLIIAGVLFFKFSQSPKQFWNDITRKNPSDQIPNSNAPVNNKSNQSSMANDQKSTDPKNENNSEQKKDAKKKLDEMFENCC